MANVTKRGKSYLIRVSDGVGVDGHQIIHSRTWKPEPGMTERQVEKELNRQVVLFEEACRQNRVGDGSIKFEKFAGQWYKEYVVPNLRERTRARYEQLQKRTFQAIGHLRLDRITPRHVQSFINNLSEPGVNERTGGGLSPKTVRHYLSYISGVMDYAVKMGMIPDNPCRNVTAPKMDKKEIDCYSLEEAAHFLKLLEQEPLKYQAFFQLAIFGGFRRGELLGLEWKDIDFDTCLVSIRRTSQYTKAKGVYTDTTKTESSKRCLKMPDVVMQTLRKYRLEQNKERLQVGDQWHNMDRVFTRWNGLPMHPNTTYLFLERFCTRHDMRRVNVHSFRHLNASLLIGEGTDIRTVSAALGHSQTSTTLNIYAHTLAEAQASAAESIADKITAKIASGNDF